MAAKNRKKNDRERDDDILSRPRFANHIRADALLSLHTNAAAKNSSARGTRAYYYPGHTAGRALANNVLCYMKELIHAQSAYSDFPVRSSAEKNNRHAENRDAKMPAAVIEIGFHTNASDAAALRDTNFRTAAMKGVEKGYRLFRAGRTGCQPFVTQNIPNASGRFNVYFHAPARYSGYPQFPVKVETKNIYCAPGWYCQNLKKTFKTPSAPGIFNITFRCTAPSNTNEPPSTFKWRSKFIDADGVTTAIKEHMTTCHR